MCKLRLRLTYSGVVSTIALIFAIGLGGAYAASTVGTRQLRNGSVTTKKLKNDAVTTNKLANNAVITGKLADQAVITGKLADDAVAAGKLADNAVTIGKLADGAVTNAKLAPNSVTGDKVAPGSLTINDIGDITEAVTTVDLSSFAAQQCGNLTVSVPGARIGQPSMIAFTDSGINNPTGLPPGLLAEPLNVAAAGQVLVRICNAAGSPSTATSGIPVRVITFG